eukprot:8826545-Pyramimonas_sp.AAC.1
MRWKMWAVDPCSTTAKSNSLSGRGRSRLALAPLGPNVSPRTATLAEGHHGWIGAGCHGSGSPTTQRFW